MTHLHRGLIRVAYSTQTCDLLSALMPSIPRAASRASLMGYYSEEDDASTTKDQAPRAAADSRNVEIRDADGYRVDPFGNRVTRRSRASHTPIEWDSE
jgi:hypothetical protein